MTAEPEVQYPDEQFLVQTEGGPHPGSRVGDAENGLSWPLPDELPDEGGRYVKVSQSALPPMPRDGHVLRGALYRWEPFSCANCGDVIEGEVPVTLLGNTADGKPIDTSTWCTKQECMDAAFARAAALAKAMDAQEFAITMTSPEVPEIDPRARQVFDELLEEFGPSPADAAHEREQDGFEKHGVSGYEL